MTAVYWFYSERGKHIFDAKKWDEVYQFRTYIDVCNITIVGVFYIFVFKMYLFWDTIYLKKIEQIYQQRDQFPENEKFEIEYSYQKI